MTHAEMNRSMAEAIVRRSLYGIQTDPKRTIRNLVDLGRETASGPLQQKFLGIAQQMLRQKDSPYYALVQDTVRRVDAERLMAFGMNLGWNSLTQGARTIRAAAARRGPTPGTAARGGRSSMRTSTPPTPGCLYAE